MLLARILSVISPLIIGGLLAVLFWQESKFYYVFILSLVFALLTLWWLIKISGSIKRFKQAVFYLLKGGLFVFGSLLFFILLENLWFKIVLVIFTWLVLFFYYHKLFIQLFKKSIFKQELKPFYFNFLEIVTIFFISSGLFGLKDFLNYKMIWLILLVFFLIFILFYFNEFTYRKNRLVYSLVTAVIMAEVFWAVLSLSLAYYLKGILFSFIYLIFIISIDSSFKKEQNRNLLKNYLIVIFIVILLILLTARWF